MATILIAAGKLLSLLVKDQEFTTTWLSFVYFEVDKEEKVKEKKEKKKVYLNRKIAYNRKYALS